MAAPAFTKSGVIDNLAADEHEAFAMIRRFLSYLPGNVWELPPRHTTDDPPDRRDPALLSLIPHDRRRVYDAHERVDAVLDRHSFFEIAPRYGAARITGLGRIDGYPVGVLANNPARQGGATDVAAGSKVVRLVQTVCASRTPWVTVVVGRLYGVAGQCQHRPSGMFRRFAWPSASWGSMHVAGGASAAYRREIEGAADPVAKREEIESRLQALASPFRTVEATGQDIIDPRDTRPLLAEFALEACRVSATLLGEPPRSYRL